MNHFQFSSLLLLVVRVVADMVVPNIKVTLVQIAFFQL
jgi:hypothetical protein